MSKFDDRVRQAMQTTIDEVVMRIIDAPEAVGSTQMDKNFISLLLDIKNEIRSIEDRVKQIPVHGNDVEDDDDDNPSEDDDTQDPEKTKSSAKRFLDEVLDDLKQLPSAVGGPISPEYQDDYDKFIDAVKKGVKDGIDKAKNDAKSIADLSVKLFGGIINAANGLRQALNFQTLKVGHQRLADGQTQIIKQLYEITNNNQDMSNALEQCCQSLNQKVNNLTNSVSDVLDYAQGNNSALQSLQSLQSRFDDVLASNASLGRLP